MLSSFGKLLAVVLLTAALVPAGAGAMVVRDSPEPAAPIALNAGAAGQGANAGFQWGDAALGAAATLALLATGGVAVRSARRRASRRGFAAG